jgi:hypothetical protein
VDHDRERAVGLVGRDQVVLKDVAERGRVAVDGREPRVAGGRLQPPDERLRRLRRGRDRRLGQAVLLALLCQDAQ